MLKIPISFGTLCIPEICFIFWIKLPFFSFEGYSICSFSLGSIIFLGDPSSSSSGSIRAVSPSSVLLSSNLVEALELRISFSEFMLWNLFLSSDWGT